MSKPTQATIFRKRQVLPARALNKALQEYGSTGGTVPYKVDGTQDESMTAALGTKTAPFGNAFFKGFNIYTEIEVQSLVSSGKITSDDRFVFWDLSSNSLKAWDGSKIIQIGGNGGNMDYLFGNGSDGDVTMVSSGNYDTVKNFKNFTLNAGVTLSRTEAGSPMIIKCTGKCTINGSINLDGKGWPPEMGYEKPVKTWISGEGSSAVGFSETRFSSIAGLTVKNRKVGGTFDENITYFLASVFDFSNIALMGGGGAGASGLVGFGSGSGNIGYRTYSYGIGGGAGGGGLIVLANEIVLNGNISCQGAAGGVEFRTDSHYDFGGGGGGGCVILMAHRIAGSGSINCAGGLGGSHPEVSKKGGNGGAGGYVKVII